MGKQVTTAELSVRLDKLATSVDTLVGALTSAAMPADEAPATPVTKVEADPAYVAHMSIKAQEHAVTKGEEVVLYTRKNKAGECKVAYALRSRYDEVVSKQPSCTGPIGSFKP
jgi:hypothetical protein